MGLQKPHLKLKNLNLWLKWLKGTILVAAQLVKKWYDSIRNVIDNIIQIGVLWDQILSVGIVLDK